MKWKWKLNTWGLWGLLVTLRLYGSTVQSQPHVSCDRYDDLMGAAGMHPDASSGYSGSGLAGFPPRTHHTSVAICFFFFNEHLTSIVIYTLF